MKNRNKYYVRLNDYSNVIIYKTMTKNEMDLLMTILFKANTPEYRNKEEIILNRKEIKETLKKEKWNITQNEIKEELIKFFKKSKSDIEILKENENYTKCSVLFQEIGINKIEDNEKECAYFKLSTLAQEIIEQTAEHFFTFYLEEYKAIKNIYAKRIYTELKQWENVGEVLIKRDELIKKLNAEKYEASNSFKQKILKPAMKELKKIYDIKEFEEIKKGRKINAYRIKFKKRKYIDIETKPINENNPFSIQGTYQEDLKANGREWEKLHDCDYDISIEDLEW